MKHYLTDGFYYHLQHHLKNGYIREAKHPTLPISIYNYTPKATAENTWDEITMNTRGLILRGQEIITYGPKKFFNRGENDLVPKINLNSAIISEKLDGYYISIKLDSDLGLIINSRGSFDNKYTSAAKKLLTSEIKSQLQQNRQYFLELLQDFKGDEGIIVTKHPIPKLVCWAIRDGLQEIIPTEENCPFGVAKKMTYSEAQKYLTNKVEGVVALNPKTFDRVKIKTEWFLDTHRIISNCTKKRVFELHKEHKEVKDLDLPNEFVDQMLDWEAELLGLVNLQRLELEKLHNKTLDYSDKEIGLSPLDSYKKSQIFNIRKNRQDQFIDKILDHIKDDFLE